MDAVSLMAKMVIYVYYIFVHYCAFVYLCTCIVVSLPFEVGKSEIFSISDSASSIAYLS